MRVNDDVPQNKIVELKDLLKTLDEKNWTVEPWSNLKNILEETDKSGHRESTKGDLCPLPAPKVNRKLT